MNIHSIKNRNEKIKIYTFINYSYSQDRIAQISLQ